MEEILEIYKTNSSFYLESINNKINILLELKKKFIKDVNIYETSEILYVLTWSTIFLLFCFKLWKINKGVVELKESSKDQIDDYLISIKTLKDEQIEGIKSRLRDYHEWHNELIYILNSIKKRNEIFYSTFEENYQKIIHFIDFNTKDLSKFVDTLKQLESTIMILDSSNISQKNLIEFTLFLIGSLNAKQSLITDVTSFIELLTSNSDKNISLLEHNFEAFSSIRESSHTLNISNNKIKDMCIKMNEDLIEFTSEILNKNKQPGLIDTNYTFLNKQKNNINILKQLT